MSYAYVSTDLLDGNAPEEKIDGPSVIIGKGRLGTAIASMGMGEDVMLGRGEAVPETIAASSGRGEEGDGEKLFCHFFFVTLLWTHWQVRYYYITSYYLFALWRGAQQLPKV